MPKVLYNLSGIEKELESLAIKIIGDTTKEVLAKFKLDYVKRYIYDSHPPPTVYDNPEKNSTFMETWEWTSIKKSAGEISTRMFNNYGKMNLNKDKYPLFKDHSVGIHGSIGFEGWDEDARPYMAEILNKKGFSSNLPISISRPVSYWDEFIKDYLHSGMLDRIIQRHAKRYGLTIK